MKSKINKIIKKIYSLIVLFFLFNLVYRDLYINLENLNKNNLIYYIFITIAFSVFLLNEKFKIKIIIFLISIYLTLLLCEITLFVFDKKKFDERSKYEIYRDLNEIKKTALAVTPASIVSNSKINFLPIGGMSKIFTINCNENGYWSTYTSDRHGFNNPDSVWEKDIIYLLIGDSFLHGSCVNEEKTISSLLRHKIKENIINLGYGSNGLPVYFMAIKELINYKSVKNIILFLYLGNDLMENSYEVFFNNKIFQEYLKNEDFTQNIFLNQNKVDRIIEEEIKKKVNDEYFKQIRIDKTSRSELSKFFTFYNFRILIKKVLKKPKNELVDNYLYFDEYLKKIQNLLENKHINLKVVILPDYELLLEQNNDSRLRYNKVIKILNDNNINSYDVYKKVFSEYEKPHKKFFSNKNSHYNEAGYRVIADKLGNYLNNKNVLN